MQLACHIGPKSHTRDRPNSRLDSFQDRQIDDRLGPFLPGQNGLLSNSPGAEGVDARCNLFKNVERIHFID